jgi:serine/threonine-protein kinase
VTSALLAPENDKPRQLEWLSETVDGRYRVLEYLGGGGMGEVYEVEHLALRRRFALKRLRAELCREARFVERFRRESLVAASLRSEHVVSIVDSGALKDGAPFFVMERLVGEDLRRLLQRGALLPKRVAAIGIDACCGLRVAHEAGLVHRDLKPENLFVTKGDDGRDVCKLLDFGVAKLLRERTDGATLPGTLIGTARYMAPEQAGTDSPVGPSADIFCLAVILYECLTGSAPFEADTLERLLFKIMNVEPAPLAERCPTLPRGLARAVTRALSKDPAARFATALDFAEALAETAPRPGLRGDAVVRGVTVEREAEVAEAEVADTDVITPPHGVSSAPLPTPITRAVPHGTSRRAVVAVPVIAALALGVFAGLAWSGGAFGDHPSSQGSVTGPLARSTAQGLVASAGPAPEGAALGGASKEPLPAAGSSPSAYEPRAVPTARPTTAAQARSPGPSLSSAHPPAVTFDPQNPYDAADRDTAKRPTRP